VAHLHRRAGFAASFRVLERDLKEGPNAAVDRLLVGESVAGDGQPTEEFARFHDNAAARLASANNLPRLQGHWLYRMIFTPHPLLERMTLLWHDHFATSQTKVNNLSLMQRQQSLIRSHALGNFGTLLREMARDPAMLVWLDCATNRKAHPNENYAREVMELFSLGRGHYSEKDIQEAARAFTGTFVQNDAYRFVESQHDPGEKTVLGKSGPLKADDIAEILLEQPVCATYLARRLYQGLISEIDEPSDSELEPLAAHIRGTRFDMRAAVEFMLRSNLFFSNSVRRRRIKSPVEYTVGTIRALEITKPTVSADALAEACVRLGQSLYAPPNVAGWDWGPGWVNTATSLARTNFALDLLDTSNGALGGRFDAMKLAVKESHESDVPGFYIDLLVQDALADPVRRSISGAISKAAAGDRAKEAARLVLTTPEYQLA
jgi:uncharacterized protein (DUF1800 family)